MTVYRRLRTAARIDRNQPEIVKALRQAGGLWVPTGYPNDGWAGYRGVWMPIEIKDGNKAPSQQKLTEAQIDFARDCESYRLPFAIVRSPEDILAVFGVLR